MAATLAIIDVDAVVVVLLVVATLTMAAARIRKLILHPLPAFTRQSGRRWALRQLGISWPLQLWNEQQAHLRIAVRLLGAAAVVAFALLPRWRIGFGPFDDEQQSRAYLQTLWQVLAAAVGVSVALIAFVLQAFLTSGERRHGGTLREFADQTRILLLFDLAAVSLCVDGLALAELGGVAPAGWPGLAASVLSGATLIALLVVVPRTMLGALDPTRLSDMRLAAARDVASRAVREQLVGQLVLNRLVADADKTGITRGLVASAGQAEIRANRNGVVHDIRLGSLRRATQRLGTASGEIVEVLVDVEQQVRRDTAILAGPPGMGWARRYRLRRCVRIRRGRADQAATAIVAVIDRLRQQALDAVRRGDEVEWRELARVVEDILLELPRSTSRLGLSFTDAISRPGFFGYGPVARVFDLMRAVVDEAMTQETEGLAESVLYTPQRVATEASSLDAPALVRDAAMFYVAAYARARRRAAAAPSPVAELVRKGAIENLFELTDRVGGHAIGFEPGEPELEAAQRDIREAFAAIQELMKSAIGAADEAAFGDALRRLAGVVEFWEEWRGDPRGRRQQELLQELATMRLVLASWSTFLLSGAGDVDRWAWLQGATRRLTDGISREQLVSAYGHLAGRCKSFGTDWNWWFYDDEAGGVQSLNSEAKLDDAFVLALARHAGTPEVLVVSGGIVPSWRHEQLQAAITHLLSDAERFAPAIGVPISHDDRSVDDTDDLGATYRQTIEAVRDALARAEQDEARADAGRTRAAPLEEARVAAFVRTANEAANGLRVLRDMLKSLGRWTLADDPGWDDRPPLVTWTNKRFYTDASGYVGQETAAGQMGRRVALGEMSELVALFKDVAPIEPEAGLGTAIEAAIDALKTEGYSPSLVICPVRGRVFEHLELKVRASPEEVEGTIVPRAHADKFNGVVGGVAVMDHPGLTDRVLVIDLGAAVHMVERPTSRDTGVEAQVRAFDAEGARGLLADAPDLVAGSLSEEEKVERIQEHARLEVAPAWRLVVDSLDAVRAVRVPEPLR